MLDLTAKKLVCSVCATSSGAKAVQLHVLARQIKETTRPFVEALQTARTQRAALARAHDGLYQQLGLRLQNLDQFYHTLDQLRHALHEPSDASARLLADWQSQILPDQSQLLGRCREQQDQFERQIVLLSLDREQLDCSVLTQQQLNWLHQRQNHFLKTKTFPRHERPDCSVPLAGLTLAQRCFFVPNTDHLVVADNYFLHDNKTRVTVGIPAFAANAVTSEIKLKPTNSS